MIDGVVMTFSDITELKRLEASFRAQHTEIATCLGCAESIIATLREPVVILDEKLRIVAASRSLLSHLPGGLGRDRGPPAL